MTVNYLLRRRKLGNTSCREISRSSNQGIQVFRNDKVLPTNPGYVFRWGCTSSIPGSPKIVNSAAAIHKVSDKAQFRIECANAGLAPKSWLSKQAFLEDEAAENIDKVVVRRRTHHQGRFLHLCDSVEEVKAACARYGEGNYYISEYIPKVAEYRVAVIQGRVAWVAKKTPADPTAIAWNVALGGRFDNVNWGEWPLKVVKIACQAMELSDLDFGGVDIMVDSDDKAYVLEINSAPSQTSPYRQSCFQKCFDYIVEHGKDKIPMTTELGGYKKFIHPAVCNEAILV